MENIWAPWRMSFIRGDQDTEHSPPLPEIEVAPDGDPECFICQAVADPEDRRRLVVRRTENTITIMNKYPYNNGHLLIAPKSHRAKLNELTPEVRAELTEQINDWIDVLQELMYPDGMNVGLNLGRAAGAGVPGHLHWHIVPRWNGDTNFMASIGSIKVIPQSLDELWGLIRERIDR
jgi:ATP adenylyltransferase